MAKLLMNDDTEYDSVYFPCFVVSKTKKIYPVFIGAPQTMKRGYIGLYMRDWEYTTIRHDKAYIFIHDPDATEEDVENIDWNEIADEVKDKKTDRNHIHIWR